MLHAIENDTRARRWCGPSVICSVAGLPMSRVRQTVRMLREQRGKRNPVTRMSTDELCWAFEAFGYKLIARDVERRPDTNGTPALPTMARWLAEREDLEPTYILNLTPTNGGHYVVVRDNQFCDSKTGKPVELSKAPGRRRRVKDVFEVIEQPARTSGSF